MRDKKQKDEDKLNIFTLAFIGEHVDIISDLTIVDYAQTETQTVEQTSPMVVQGYLLDHDDKYFYIGDNSLEVSQAIAKKNVVLIRIEKKKSKYEKLLEEMNDDSSENIN